MNDTFILSINYTNIYLELAIGLAAQSLNTLMNLKFHKSIFSKATVRIATLIELRISQVSKTVTELENRSKLLRAIRHDKP